MKPLNKLARRILCGAALAACFAAPPGAGAQDAAAGKPAGDLSSSPSLKAEGPVARPSASPAGEPVPVVTASDSKKPAQNDPLEQKLEAETSELHKLEAELKALESVPLPGASSPATEPKPQQVKLEPDLKEIPKEPAKNLEEEYANALYAMGKYDLARAAYERVLQSKPKEDVITWAHLQIGNCARRAGSLQEAASAYEALMTTSPGSPWTAEATWWAGEMKWWMLWNQAAK